MCGNSSSANDRNNLKTYRDLEITTKRKRIRKQHNAGLASVLETRQLARVSSGDQFSTFTTYGLVSFLTKAIRKDPQILTECGLGLSYGISH